MNMSYSDLPNGYLETIDRGIDAVRHFTGSLTEGAFPREEAMARLGCELETADAVVSGAIELCMHYFGEASLAALHLNAPFFGELAAGALGLVPNCAVSVAGAELYCQGAMSAGALMASSFTGSGLGLLVLLRTNRNWRENLAILATVYVAGVALGGLTGCLL